uniref:uncharacterized protein isoform X2 n=1 Tax=Pristiophorus japonicus TaxID=55135 RepID=UPI00398E860A
MARETEEDAANAVYQRSRECMETAGASTIDLDELWNVKKNISLGYLKTAKSSSSTTKFYSRYGGIRGISGTGPDMRTLSRTTDITLEMKWSSKSKENQMNRVAHNSQNKEDEFDF